MSVDASHPLAWLFARPIAHRGLHDRTAGIIENSTSAFDAAIARSFGIECDVQLTMDGEAVVFHDFDLDRLTDARGPLIDRYSDDLERITLKGSMDSIATLDTIISRVGGKVPLVIEIKSRFDGDLRLAKRVVEIVKARGASIIALKSFDPSIVAYLAENLPGMPRGFIGMNSYHHGEFAHLSAVEKKALAELEWLGRMTPDFLSWKVADLEEAAPLFARVAPDLPVMTWTVRTAADRALAAQYADQMVFEGFLP